MTLHLEGIHICHIRKQWLWRPYRYSLSAKKWDENIGQNGLSRRNLHGQSRHPCCLGPIKHGGPKRARPLFPWSYHNRKLLGRDSWRVSTPHVQSFVFISMLKGQPKTPPSGDDLAVLNHHLNHRDLASTTCSFILMASGALSIKLCEVRKLQLSVSTSPRHFFTWSPASCQ